MEKNFRFKQYEMGVEKNINIKLLGVTPSNIIYIYIRRLRAGIGQLKVIGSRGGEGVENE